MQSSIINHMRCAVILMPWLGIVFLATPAPSPAAPPELTLSTAVAMAHANDPWLDGSRYREQATEALGVAAGELPDPDVSIGFANLPVDGFDFGTEPMTQFKVAVSQAFPRGDTRKLKQQQLREVGGQHPYMRENRRAEVTTLVSTLWLEAYRNQEAIRRIEEDRTLFEHLVELAESNYASAMGKTKQQDMIRAQLELTQLEDRLTRLRQEKETMLARLSEWLADDRSDDFPVSRDLPQILSQACLEAINSGELDDARLVATLLAHPKVKGLQQKIAASNTGIELAKQKYKPQWDINVGYGYRADDRAGRSRSSLVSLGVTFDLPLFPSNRQDQETQAAMATERATHMDKALAVRSMRAAFDASRARLRRLNQRRALYEDRLLQEVHDQAEASLTAYTNDAGDFSEVVHARIVELNANIDFLNINIDRLKAIAELGYFFVSANACETGGTAR